MFRSDRSVNLRILVLCVLLCAWLQAMAQETDDASPEVQALIDALRPLPATRGVAQPPRAASVGVAVPFDVGSVRLTEQGRRSLEALGEALTSATLEPYEFSIEVHVQAQGTPSRDKLLSKRQANAIKDYLVKQHQVSPARLITEGRGSGKLRTTSLAPHTANVFIINSGPVP
jgi:outer membrane protein OmpA-like peptidoglycan-associated protein